MSCEADVLESPTEAQIQVQPLLEYFRQDRMPHIWCPGCGIGTAVNSFNRGLSESKIPWDNISIVSGIGCTGRVAGYLKMDSFHTTHGRAIPFATGLQLGNPDLKVVVISGDGDLAAIGGNHFIHAARRNIDILVVCINNFTYGMTGGQAGPTTPLESLASTAPFGSFEHPFNLPYLAESSGASYVARWTTFHIRQVSKAVTEAINKKGFRFIEIISSCPTLFGRRNKLGDGLDEMKFFKEHSKIQNNANTKEIDITTERTIIVGKFVDNPRPTFVEAMNLQFKHIFGDKYTPYGNSHD